jgi:hypothetical protein
MLEILRLLPPALCPECLGAREESSRNGAATARITGFPAGPVSA